MFEDEPQAPQYANTTGTADVYGSGTVCLRWAVAAVGDEEAGEAAHGLADAAVRRSRVLSVQVNGRCIWKGLCERPDCDAGGLLSIAEDDDEVEERPFINEDQTETTLDDCPR